jgi:hypothetical protein
MRTHYETQRRRRAGTSNIMNYALFSLAIACLIGMGVLTMMACAYADGDSGLHPAIVSVCVAVLAILGFKACSLVCEG